MAEVIELKTERLKLRQWKRVDFPLFSEMNSDPEVLEYYPNTMSKSESDEMASKIQLLISKRGWGFWAVEEKSENKKKACQNG